MTFRVGAHNAHDQKAAVAEALQQVDLYLGSEAVPVDAPGWEHRTGGKGVVTAWRADVFQHHRSRWHVAHGGRAKVTPTRGSLVSEFEVRGLPLAVVNGHRINGTGWPGTRRRSFRDWRRARWLEHDAMDRAIVADLHDAGYTVLLGADVNRTDMEPPHPDAVPLRNGGITQLWLIPAWPVILTDEGSVGGLATGSSHRLQWAALKVTP